MSTPLDSQFQFLPEEAVLRSSLTVVYTVSVYLLQKKINGLHVSDDKPVLRQDWAYHEVIDVELTKRITLRPGKAALLIHSTVFVALQYCISVTSQTREKGRTKVAFHQEVASNPGMALISARRSRTGLTVLLLVLQRIKVCWRYLVHAKYKSQTE